MSQDLVEKIQGLAGLEPVQIGLILGSGLGALADEVDGVRIAYSDLPGFPHSKVSGHSAELVIGTLHGVRVAVFSGREHYYENGRADAMRVPLQVLAGLGAKALLATMRRDRSAPIFRRAI